MSRRVLYLPSALLVAMGCNAVARRGYHETQARENKSRLENYADLPFAIGRCGNIGKLKSRYLAMNVDDSKCDWRRYRGRHHSFQYEFDSSSEGLSDGRPEKQYSRWSTGRSARADDEASWPRIKDTAEILTRKVGLRLADKELQDELDALRVKMLERGHHHRWWVGGNNTTLDGVEYLPARIVAGRKFPKNDEKSVTVDYDASEENWQRWRGKRKRLEIDSIRRHGPMVLLQFKLDQRAEWDERAWARDEARKFLIVEDIPPFVCTMKSITGVGTARGPAPAEQDENPEKVVYVEDYGIPRRFMGGDKWIAHPITTVTVTDFRGRPVDLREVDAWRAYDMKRVYGQYIYVRRSVSHPYRESHLGSPFRRASHKTSWVTDDGKLIVISQTDRFPKELVKAYLEKYPSAVE